MIKYGAYQRKHTGVEVVWFVTEQSIEAGAYVLGSDSTDPPNVIICESIAGLILEIYPAIQALELDGQKTLCSPGMDSKDANRMADNLAEGLIQRLTEDHAMWIIEPEWVSRLRPVD